MMVNIFRVRIHLWLQINIIVTKVENHARYDAILVVNELIQIKVFVSILGNFEVWCGYLWISGLEKALRSELIGWVHMI